MTIGEQEKLREASEWWLRLREDAAPAQAADWLAWSQENAQNLDAFDRIETLAGQLRDLPQSERAELLREFAPACAGPGMSGQSEQSRSSRWSRWPLALAATVALAFIAGLYLNSSQGGITYVTERAMHQEVTLSDGSLLTVGASSKVSINMRAAERHVKLRSGEAYFRVQKDTMRPFVVEAGDVTVIAIGTAFDVRRTGDDIAVGVTEGRVRVTWSNGKSVEMSAGKRLSYEPRSQRLNVSAISPDRAAAWRERRLEFVNEPLGTVIANVNRYASRRVMIADAAAARLTFTGTVLPENLSGWLDALPNVLPVRVDLSEETVRVESASTP